MPMRSNPLQRLSAAVQYLHPKKGKDQMPTSTLPLTPGLTHRPRAGFGYFLGMSGGVCAFPMCLLAREAHHERDSSQLSLLCWTQQTQALLPWGGRAMVYLILAHFVGRELCQHGGSRIPAGQNGLGWFPSATRTAQLPDLPGKPLGFLFSSVLFHAQNLMIALCAGCCG